LSVLTVPLFGITVGAVQWQVSEKRYSSIDTFETAARYWLDQTEVADLVIFPEYTSVFCALFFSEGTDPANVKAGSAQTRAYLDQFWGKEAQQRNCWILAGTYLEESQGNLYNTALIYGPEGSVVYEQQKCFLGDLEKKYGLSEGKVSEVNPFEIQQIPMALTICRDTYHEIWEEHFTRGQLWIDIKANELEYTEEYYHQALPSRLPDSVIPYGLTVSLTGSIMDYSFEGITQWRDRIRPLLESWSITEETYLLFPLEQP